LTAEPAEARIVPQFAFVHDEPGTFDRVTGIQRAPVVMIQYLAARSDGFHQHLVFRFHEISFDRGQIKINPFRAGAPETFTSPKCARISCAVASPIM
jgi:hypothetical protein